MTHPYFARVACLLVLAGALSACDENPVLPLAEVRDFRVVDIQGVCEGRTPSLAVDFTVQGYTLRDIRQGDSFFVLSSALLPGSDLRIEPNVSVTVGSVPDGVEHSVRLVKPLDPQAGLVAGQTVTIDVRTGRDGALTDAYQAVQVTLPTCS